MKKKKFFIGVIGSLSVFMINPNSRLITKTKTIPIEQNFKKATFNQSGVQPITTFLATKEAYADSSLSNKAFSDWVDSVPSGLIAEIKKTSIYINSFNKWKLRQDSGHGNSLYKDTEAFVNNDDASNSYFNTWKATAKGQEVLKQYYEKWSEKKIVDHETSLYNTWRLTRTAALKTVWEATSDFTTKARIEYSVDDYIAGDHRRVSNYLSGLAGNRRHTMTLNIRLRLGTHARLYTFSKGNLLDILGQLLGQLNSGAYRNGGTNWTIDELWSAGWRAAYNRMLNDYNADRVVGLRRDVNEIYKQLSNPSARNREIDTNYTTWADTEYKADTVSYNRGLDSWSLTKANGLDTYKTSLGLTGDYETWIKNQWEASGGYQTFNYWTGFKPNWKPAYMHKNVWNLPSQADKDRITWLKGEYEKTDDFKALIKTHYGTKAKALAFYKRSIQLTRDYFDYVGKYNANVAKWHELKPGMNNTHLASYDDYKRSPQAWLERYIDGYKKDDFLNDYATTDLFTQSEIDALKSKIAGLDELEKSKAIFTFFKNQVAKVKAKVDQNKKVTFDQWLQNNGHTLDDWIAANKDKIVAYWKTQTSAFNASYNKYAKEKVASDGTSLSKRDIKTWAFDTAEGRTLFGNWIKSKVLNNDYANVYKKYMQVLSGNYKAFSQVHQSEEEAWNHIKKVYPWFAKFAIGMADHNAGVLESAKGFPQASSAYVWLRNNIQYFNDWKRTYTYNDKNAHYWRTSGFYKKELSNYMENGPSSILAGKRTLNNYATHSSNSGIFQSWKTRLGGIKRNIYYKSTSGYKDALKAAYPYNDWLGHTDFNYDQWFLGRLGFVGLKTFDDFTFKTSQTGTPDKFKTIKKGTSFKDALHTIISSVENGVHDWSTSRSEATSYYLVRPDSNYYQKWENMLSYKDQRNKANLKDTLDRFLRLQNTHEKATHLNSAYLSWASEQFYESARYTSSFRNWDSNINSYLPWYSKSKTLVNSYNNFKKTNFESNSTPNTYKNEFSDWTNLQATYLFDKTRPHALGEGYSKWVKFLKGQYNANKFKAHWQKNLDNMDAAKAKWYYDITLKMYNKDAPTLVPDFLKSKEALSAYSKWNDPSVVSISRDQYVASSQGVKDYNSFIAANRSSLETLWKADYQAAYDKYLDDNDKLYEKIQKAKSIADKVWFARNQFKATDDYINQLKLDLNIISHKELAVRIKKTYVYYLKETLKTK